MLTIQFVLKRKKKKTVSKVQSWFINLLIFGITNYQQSYKFQLTKYFSLLGHSPPSDGSPSSGQSVAGHFKEELMDEGAVSPPPQSQPVPVLIAAKNESLQRKTLANYNLSHTQPRAETRKTGTCYFCKKAFMKNKQVLILFFG
jgi:hypothetical protein